MKNVYMLEVGIDNGKYDENIIFFNTLEEAREYGINYVNKGVESTYYSIFNYIIDDDCYVSEDGNLRYIDNDMYCDWELTQSENMIESKVKYNKGIFNLYSILYHVGAHSYDYDTYFKNKDNAFEYYNRISEKLGDNEVYVQKEYWNKITHELDYCNDKII